MMEKTDFANRILEEGYLTIIEQIIEKCIKLLSL